MITKNTAQGFRKVVRPVVSLMKFLRLTPDALTIIGLMITAFSAFFIAGGNFLLGGILLLFSGLFDTLDGELARATSKVSSRGAFLDSSADRLAEFIILGSFVYWSLFTEPLFFTAPWTDKNSFILILFGVLFGSLLTSYLRARAEGLGNSAKAAFFARPERVIFTALIAIIGKKIIFWGMVVFLILVGITCIQRFYSIWKNFSGGKNG